jgi:hypothetical protein
MTTKTSPRVVRIDLLIIHGGIHHRLTFGTIAEADATLAEMFAATVPADDRTRIGWVGGTIEWSDGYDRQPRFYVTPEHLRNAQADGGILRHALLSQARMEADPSMYPGHSRALVAKRTAAGRRYLARIEAEHSTPRNVASTVPRVARVHITTADNPAVRPGLYRSIAYADAMLDEAFAAVPAPEGKPFSLLTGVVIWTDGYELRPRVYVNAEHVRDAVADGGILRHALLRAARARANPDTYRGAHPDVIAQHAAAGRAVLARIEADAAHEAEHRNTSTWNAPSLFPDPAQAIVRLRDRFADRRRIIAAVGDREDGTSDGTGYPATNHADVRYVSNHITLALRNDLRSLDPTAAAIVWNHWRSVRDTIETLLRKGDDAAEYGDNEGFWIRQLPALVRLLDDTRGRRNGALHFRPVGERGDAYPAWVTALRGLSGAYVIRAPGTSGEREIVYVGSSSADRLYETLTRHLQVWRRWQGYGRDYGEGHDPGLTYNRDTAEAAVVVTPRAQALDMETHLIETLRPRDNILGKPNTEDWEWFLGTSNGSAYGAAEDAPF